MNDDEFMKELDEVTKSLEQEYVKNQTTNTDNKQNPLPNLNQSLDPNILNCFQNFDFGNDSNNINQLKKLFGEFDDSDPESNEMMKKISKFFF